MKLKTKKSSPKIKTHDNFEEIRINIMLATMATSIAIYFYQSDNSLISLIKNLFLINAIIAFAYVQLTGMKFYYQLNIYSNKKERIRQWSYDFSMGFFYRMWPMLLYFIVDYFKPPLINGTCVIVFTLIYAIYGVYTIFDILSKKSIKSKI